MTRQQALEAAVRNVRPGWPWCMPYVAAHGWSRKGSGEASIERDMRMQIRAEFRRIMSAANRYANGVELCR